MAATARFVTALAVLALVAIDAIYLIIVRQQGTDPSEPLVVPFVAAYIALMGALLVASLLTPPAWAPALRGGASAGLLVLGALSAFSIGLGVLFAATLAIAATVLALIARPGARSAVSTVLSALVVVALLVVGFQVAWSHLACPASGEGGGTTPSFFGQGSSYECNGGVLTVHR